ncbi:MAG: response regulator [Proteobacteria bacterium]|nr:response regulator [Pseudomonadota bacterium]MBU1060003.1 response regulator [Pseudomonadota bacterium]
MIAFHSIRAKILFTQLSLLLLTIFIVSSSSYVFMENSLRSSQERQLTQFASQFALQIHNDLKSIRQHLEDIATSRELEVYSQNFQDGILREIFSNDFGKFAKLAYLNEEGREEAKVLKGKIVTTYLDMSERQIIQEVRANPNRVVFSAPYFSQEIDSPALQAAILQQGYFHDEFIGIIVGTLALQSLQSDMLEPTIGKSGFFRLIDQDGTILLSPKPEEILTHVRVEGDEEAQVFAHDSGVIKKTINGLDGFVAYASVSQTSWSILVTLPASEFFDGMRKLKETIVLLSAILFLVSFLLALFLSNLITRPIEQLIKATEKVGKGDFKQKIAITSRDEMGTLAESFNTMTAELGVLQQRDKQLTEEKKRSEQKLHRAEKMEAIGLMAGGVAHDLNNILSGVVSYPELLLHELPNDHLLRQSLLTIKQSGARAVAVVADLLTVARGIASIKEVTSFNTLITTFVGSGECSALCRRYPAITLSTELSPDTGNICCSPVHIHKLLLNLVTNAFEAVQGSGTVTIRTENELGGQSSDPEGPGNAGRHVVLQVSDSGSGISEQDMKKIFEPYYSKKVLGRSGTGLGLSVVWSIVKEHDGQIAVSSDGNSTVFTVLFPVCLERPQEIQAQVSLADLQGKGTILMVDDEALQREIAERMLNSLGYSVRTVSSGEEAIAYLEKHSVDLVLLDMIMDPGINGSETYVEIKKLHPGQKAVIASGFSESTAIQEAKALGVGTFIKKPYSMEELGRAILQELQG